MTYLLYIETAFVAWVKLRYILHMANTVSLSRYTVYTILPMTTIDGLTLTVRVRYKLNHLISFGFVEWHLGNHAIALVTVK